MKGSDTTEQPRVVEEHAKAVDALHGQCAGRQAHHRRIIGLGETDIDVVALTDRQAGEGGKWYPPEMHPEWRDHLDWLGLQYYFRSGVSRTPEILPRVRANLCLPNLDLGACVPAPDATHRVPTMGYEF